MPGGNRLGIGPALGGRDIAVDLLQSFHSLASGVMLPLLRQPAVVKGCVPDVKYQALLDETHHLVAESLMTLGRAHDQTLLPIPPVTLPARVTPETAGEDRAVVHQLPSPAGPT